MAIYFDNSKPFTDEQISEIELLFGTPLSEEVKQFYLKYGGSEPHIDDANCGVIIEDNDGWQVESVINSVPNYVELKTALLQNYLEYLKGYIVPDIILNNKLDYRTLFPIFNLPNGAVYIVVDGKQKGRIYVADNGDMGLVYSSLNLLEFLTKLYKLPV
ncbi:MAG: SMI1/KNR4 family protein [Hymenobacter sp.]|nr:MAG: SMI1/KNR4 family protein [Hymenobacter sp.]